MTDTRMCELCHLPWNRCKGHGRATIGPLEEKYGILPPPGGLRFGKRRETLQERIARLRKSKIKR